MHKNIKICHTAQEPTADTVYSMLEVTPYSQLSMWVHHLQNSRTFGLTEKQWTRTLRNQKYQDCSFRGPGFTSQHPHGGLHPSVTSVLSDLTSEGTSTHVHRCPIQAKHPHPLKFFSQEMQQKSTALYTRGGQKQTEHAELCDSCHLCGVPKRQISTSCAQGPLKPRIPYLKLPVAWDLVVFRNHCSQLCYHPRQHLRASTECEWALYTGRGKEQ